MVPRKQTTATTLFIAGGIVLAVLFATLVSRSVPEHYTNVVSTPTTSSINFAVLDRGANVADLERGRVYYLQLCVSCHGMRGDGEGEWAYRVTPHPSALNSTRVQERSDDYLFNIISDGLVGTAMSGWKEQLSVQQRWQIVAYLRHLGVQETKSGWIGS